MRSLLNVGYSEEVVMRLEMIEPATLPFVRKTNAAQMMVQVIIAIKMAMGDIKKDRDTLSYLFGKIAKRMIITNKPFPKNVGTAKGMKINNQRDFEKEKAELVTLVNMYTKLGEAGITRHPHPFFWRANIRGVGPFGE